MFADLRFAFRSLLNTPAFTAHALLTLILGFSGVATLSAVTHSGSAAGDATLVESPVQALTAVAWLLLVAACANVATLLLERVDARHHELAIRRAIGAGRRRLIAQLLAEGILIGVLGAAGGVLTASWALEGLWTLGTVRTAPPGIDVFVATMHLLIAPVLAVAFGIGAARRGASADVHDVLRDDESIVPVAAAPRRRLGAVLVASEVTISVLLAVAWLSSRDVPTPEAGTPLITLLIGFCAAISFALTTLGIYVVTAYDLSRRSRELGVRIALGARSADVLRLTISGAMRSVVAGLIVGIVGTLGLQPKLDAFEVGGRPATASSVAAVVLALAAVALAATTLPAARAIRAIPTRSVKSA